MTTSALRLPRQRPLGGVEERRVKAIEEAARAAKAAAERKAAKSQPITISNHDHNCRVQTMRQFFFFFFGAFFFFFVAWLIVCLVTESPSENLLPTKLVSRTINTEVSFVTK